MALFDKKRILVATDFSESSKVALNICISAFKCMKTKLYILHAIEKLPHDYRHSLFRTAYSDVKQRLEENAINKINAMLPNDMQGANNATPIVRYGKPFVEVIKAAKEIEADIIVIASHRMKGMGHVISSSVSEKVVRKAHCPVFVIKKEEFTGFQRIIVPIDFSDCSRIALEYAIAIAKAHNGKLTILHVYDEAFFEPYIRAANSQEEADEIVRKIEEINENNYNEFLKKVDLTGVEYEKLLKEGVPSNEIVGIARQQDAQLIVMGTHGRSGLKHILIGSDAEEVVREAPCNIIVVKPEKFDFVMP